MIVEQFLPMPRGGILYDAARLRKPDAALFTREYWVAQSAFEDVAGGRGTVSILHTQEGEWVWRHYRRGGLVARIANDRYLWLGASSTRAFREWRLLAALRARGLPVPPPIAAKYERIGLTYRADIMTERIPSARTLAQCIQEHALEETIWQGIGETIARFHAAGVHHADLNANNIMLAPGGVYVLDFDRGRIRARGAWESAVIARLRRSLEKIKTLHAHAHFSEPAWRALLSGLSEQPGS